MRRTKPPVLTSPWKIGFFVSLMLVFVSIGVTYFFTYRFGVSWNLLDRDWLDRNEWLGVIRGQGFLFEVLPLLGLVAVTSMISYFVITAAVRKYKRYLDSGLDYKNLLSSLKDLEDLEDKSKIERMNNHPELKRLLLNVAQTLEERGQLLSEREGVLETRVDDAVKSKENEMTEDFGRQCEQMARAIEGGGVELSEIETSSPGLRRLGETLRAHLRSGEVRGETDLAESYGNLRKTSDVLQSKLRDIAADLRAIREGAQDIEEQLKQLAETDPGDLERSRLDSACKEVRTILVSLRSLEELNTSIDMLSEEAKGVAINAALHAGSGEGTQDDLIRLAEEVKEVATRFKETTKRFSGVSAAIRSSAGDVEKLLGGPVGPRGDASDHGETLAGVLSRMTLCVERVVVLSDLVSNFRESYGVAVSSLPTSAVEEVAEETESRESAPVKAEDAGEFGFETLDRNRSLFGDTGESPVGFEDEKREIPGIFEQITPVSVESDDEPTRGEQEIEEEHTRDRDRIDDLGFDEESRMSDSEPAEEDIVPEESLAVEGDGLEPTGEEPDFRGHRPSGEAPAKKEAASADEADEVVDLYALGAVDYDPALHG